jgi:hypothetical protein
MPNVQESAETRPANNERQSDDVMLNHQTFSFGEVPDAVRLSISEGDIPGDDFGLHVWPSGRVLAYYLWDLRTTVEFDKLRVLELGCGVSISVRLAGLFLNLYPVYRSFGRCRAYWLQSWELTWC